MWYCQKYCLFLNDVLIYNFDVCMLIVYIVWEEKYITYK